MQDEKSIWNSAVSFLKVLQPAIKAIKAIEQNDTKSAQKNAALALKAVVLNWSNLEYGWNQLYDATSKFIGDHVNNQQLAIKQPSSYGFYTGKWSEIQTKYYILTYQNKNSSIVNLYWPKESGDYNTYTGVLDNTGVLVWNGFNSQGRQLFLIGYPYNDDNNIQLYTWFLNKNTNEFELLDVVYLTYC